MKVLFDHQIFSMQSYGGVSRYFSELIHNLQNEKLADVELSLQYSDNVYLNERNFVQQLHFIPKRLRKRVYSQINFQESKRRIQNSQFDVLHPTYFDDYFFPLLNGKPFVLTIYDMIYELYPEMFNDGGKSAVRKKVLAEKAKKKLLTDPKKVYMLFNCNEKEHKEFKDICGTCYYCYKNKIRNCTTKSNKIIRIFCRTPS